MLEVDAMSAASPELGTRDADALRDSIARLGQLVPIVMWRGKVIDGRKRLVACEALGLEPVTVAIPDDATATDYAAALNILRTHYSAGQRAMYAAALANAPRGYRPDRDKSDAGSSLHVTADQAAERAGVHRSDVQNAKKVRKHGAPEVAAAVERGDLSLMSAVRIVRDTPKHEQPAIVERARVAKGSGKRLPPGTLTPPAKYKALPKRNVVVVIGKCLANIEASCDVLDQHGEHPPKNGERTAWLASIDTSLATLRRFRRRLTTEDGE